MKNISPYPQLPQLAPQIFRRWCTTPNNHHAQSRLNICLVFVFLHCFSINWPRCDGSTLRCDFQHSHHHRLADVRIMRVFLPIDANVPDVYAIELFTLEAVVSGWDYTWSCDSDLFECCRVIIDICVLRWPSAIELLMKTSLTKTLFIRSHYVGYFSLTLIDLFLNLFIYLLMMIENILWMDYANDWRSSDWKISYLFRVQIHINYHVIGHILLLMIILNDWAFHATFIVKTLTEYINEVETKKNILIVFKWIIDYIWFVNIYTLLTGEKIESKKIWRCVMIVDQGDHTKKMAFVSRVSKFNLPDQKASPAQPNAVIGSHARWNAW